MVPTCACWEHQGRAHQKSQWLLPLLPISRESHPDLCPSSPNPEPHQFSSSLYIYPCSFPSCCPCKVRASEFVSKRVLMWTPQEEHPALQQPSSHSSAIPPSFRRDVVGKPLPGTLCCGAQDGVWTPLSSGWNLSSQDIHPNCLSSHYGCGTCPFCFSVSPINPIMASSLCL